MAGLAIATVAFGTQYFVTDLLSTQLAFTSFVGIDDVFAIAPLVLGVGALIATLAAAVSTYQARQSLKAAQVASAPRSFLLRLR